MRKQLNCMTVEELILDEFEMNVEECEEFGVVEYEMDVYFRRLLSF